MKIRMHGHALLIAGIVGLTSCAADPAEPGQEEVRVTRAVLANPWTQFAAQFPTGSPPMILAMLTDGRVLAAAEMGTQWYTLSPDPRGSYTSGFWTQVGSSNLGRFANPSFVLRDGRLLNCGGEYMSDNYERAFHPGGQDSAHCELFNPTTNVWSQVDDMPEAIWDTPAVELDNGQVFFLSHNSVNTYLFHYFNEPIAWTMGPASSTGVLTQEGSSVLLPDGSALFGNKQFERYLPGQNVWVNAAQTPGLTIGEFLPSPLGDEIGPFMLLQQGTVLVLGGSSHNGIFTPPTTSTGLGSWSLQDETATFLNHADTPAAAEPDGKVLTFPCTDSSGAGQSVVSVYEFDPSVSPGNGQWTGITSPVGAQVGNRVRTLNLPNGQILVSGAVDGTLYAYNPAGTPAGQWRPTVSPIGAPTAGEFTLNGSRLNGLTNGSDFGDDAKGNANYPIVSLTSSSGAVYYARSYNFDHMAPGAATTCKFVLPPTIVNGTYVVRATANGVGSMTNGMLTVSGIHVAALTTSFSPANIGQSTTWQVVLSANAPSGGTRVNLQSSDAGVATLPASVTVTAGQKIATFAVTTRGFGAATLTAQLNTANPQFKPVTAPFGWSLTKLTGPPVNAGDLTATWTLGISTFAPSNGVTVNLVSSNPSVATVPATVVVPNGNTLVTFAVGKGPTTNGLAKITASMAGTSLSFTVATNPIMNLGGSDTSLTANGAMTYWKCANEGQVCITGDSGGYLAFGSDGSYIYRISNGSTVNCDAASLGAPAGQGRACWLSSFSFIGNEGMQLGVAGDTREIAFGGNGKFAYKRIAGTFSCAQSTFGGANPSPGSNVCLAGVPAHTLVALDFQSLPQAVQPVAYGTNGRFYYGVFGNGTQCGPNTFTGSVPQAGQLNDPTPGFVKGCYALVSTKVGDEGTSLNLPSKTVYYGSGLNGVFLKRVVTDGICNFSFFGGDPDFGHFKHCWAAP